MAFGESAEDRPDHYGRLGVRDLAPVVSEGIPASYPEVPHGHDPVRRNRQLGEETGDDRVPLGRPSREQKQIAIAGVDDLAEVGEDLPESVADGPVDGLGIDAEGDAHEIEGGPGLPLNGFVDVPDKRLGRVFGKAGGFGARFGGSVLRLEEIRKPAFLRAAGKRIGVLVLFEHARHHGPGNLTGELGTERAVALRTANSVAAEKLSEKIAGIGESGGLSDAGQDMLLHDLADHVVARDVEAVPELHMRPDAGGGGLVAGDGEGGDAQIDGAAADIHVGDAQGGGFAVASAAHELEKAPGVALKLLGDFIVEVHELRAGGLVPTAPHVRADPVVGPGIAQALLGGVPLAPAEGLPDHPHGPRHPAAVDLLFRDGHGAGHGEDDPLEAAGHVGLFAFGALRRGVDGHERVHDDLAEEEHHGGTAGKMGLEGDVGLLRAQDFGARGHARILEAGQRRAFAVDLLDEDAAGDGRFEFRTGAPGVEAPLLGAGGFVPEIALGAGHAGVAFRTHGVLGEAGGFRSDAHHRGPDEGRGAAARAGAEAGIAEGCLREFDACGEGAGIGALGLAQIAYLKEIAVVQVGLTLRQGFHEHACGAGIAEVEHEVHIHGRQVSGVHHAHGGHGGHGAARRKRLKQCEVGGEVLHDERRILTPAGPPVVTDGLVGVVDFGQPLVHPQRVEEPRVVTAFRRQGEAGVFRHIVGAEGEILARGLFALLDGGVEQEGQTVNVAILAADVEARPVARALLTGEGPVLPLLVGKPQERHGNPAALEGIQRPDGVDFVIIVAGLSGVVHGHRDEFRRAARGGDGGFPALRHFAEVRPEPAQTFRVEAAVQKLRTPARNDAHC